MSNKKIKILSTQLGARMHYAVPQIIYKRGWLSELFTDITGDSFIGGIQRYVPVLERSKTWRKLRGRTVPMVPRAFIKENLTFGVIIWFLRNLGKGDPWRDLSYLIAGKVFSILASRRLNKDHSAVFCYDGAAKEVFAQAKKIGGIKCIYEQTMAPRFVADSLIEKSRQQYPEWNRSSISKNFLAPYVYAREAAEWELADHIICGSSFVRDGLITCGVNEKKIYVIPYGVEFESISSTEIFTGGRKLRILTVGAVSLRKGAPQLYQSAVLLQELAEFRIIGPIDVSQSGLDRLKSVADVRGGVPRSEVGGHYKWADVFLLPSICEGSATVTYEAAAYGLPQIVTQNVGSLVVDNLDGLVVESFSVKDLVAAVKKMACPDEYKRLHEGASNRRVSYSLDRYEHDFSLFIEKYGKKT